MANNRRHKPPNPSPPPPPPPPPPPVTGSFSLTGLTSPATVAETIFVNASAANGATKVDFYIDDVLVNTQTAAPFSMGGAGGYSTDSLAAGTHTLTAVGTPSGISNAVTLNVVPSINGTFSAGLAPYANHPTAQSTPVATIVSNVSTAGASLTAAELAVRAAIATMYANWGIDISLDYANDISAVLTALIPKGQKAPAAPTSPYSMCLSPDAPYYHPIPANWPRVQLPVGYISTLQLNTNQGDDGDGDGIGFGISVAAATTPNLTVTSEWPGAPSTLVTFPYRIVSNWAAQIPSTAAGDKHVIFIDPVAGTFISSYLTTVDSKTKGPDGYYITSPTSFNSLGATGGSVASEMAELPIMIQPGEATNASNPIPHAICGPVGRTWAARVFPAAARDADILTSTNGCTGSGKTNNGLVPYGGIIQLDPAVNLASLTLSLPARRILEAFQTYGYYVVDFGCGDFDIYTAIGEAELDPYGGSYGNSNGPGVQGEVEKVLVANKLYVVAPLTKKN